MHIVSVAQIIALEKQANQMGMDYETMMSNAGKALADVVKARYSQENRKNVLGLVGGGNNGGDTIIALTHLAQLGWQVRAYLTKTRSPQERIMNAFINAGGVLTNMSEDQNFDKLKRWTRQSDIILDGILGTGFKLPLKSEIHNLLTCVSSIRPNADIIAVDCPSGIDCDSGEVASACLKADLTVCMAAVKQGLVKFPAFELVGDLTTVSIGLPHSLSGWKDINGCVVDREAVRIILPQRRIDGHKGTYGTCLVIAGSDRYCGAVRLCCEAAYRMGVGLVQAAIPDCIYNAIAGSIPEAIWLPLPSKAGMIDMHAHQIIKTVLNRISVILVGPGLGLGEHTRQFLNNLLMPLPDIDKNDTEDELPGQQGKLKTIMTALPKLVIDADGLKHLRSISGWHKKIPQGSVLTPHPGEMAILTDRSIDAIQSDRIQAAVDFAAYCGHVVVLKGALTVIAKPNKQYSVVPFATDALASAGTGDVLAGMIAGLMAQGVKGYDAAVSCVYLHAQAGMMAANSLGSSRSVIASDVINFIPYVLKKNTGK